MTCKDKDFYKSKKNTLEESVYKDKFNKIVYCSHKSIDFVDEKATV